jgi:DNA-binding response OmpR family regulator
MTNLAALHTTDTRPAPRALVLIVDANLAALKPVTGCLAEHFALTFATDGMGAVHRAQSQLPQLVLMDTDLPGLDGLSACRLLKADAQTTAIPLLLMSTRATPPDRVQGLRAGASDYLAKPLWPEEVLVRTQVHLQAAAQLSEANAATALPQDPERAYVEAAKRLIGEHLSALPCVAQLAQEVGLGARRLSTLFHSYVGQTVQAYISEQRIRASFKLLEKTSMSVQAVALEVGFATPGNFATAFKARTGMTPLAWRKQRTLGF